MTDTLLERFLTYVKIDTQSSEEGHGTPSTQKQFDLSKLLLKELHNLGLESQLTDKCIVYGYLKANEQGHDPVGFIAHVDTSPEASDTNVKPQIVEKYDGKAVKLNKEVTLDPAYFPYLGRAIGKTLITTDGTTLLGADDKAGVSEIMEMLSLITTKKLPHGDIYVAFTPDEEIGGGID